MSLEDTPQEGISGDAASQDQNESFGEIRLATGTQEQAETNNGDSPSDEIANSTGKLGEDFAVSESMESEASYLISADAGADMNLDTISEEEQPQQQKQHYFPQESLPQSGDDDGQPSGEDGLFAGSATGDESGDNTSNQLNTDEEGDAICQPIIPNNSLAISEFPSVGTAETPATPTHRRTNSDTNRKKRLCRFPGCTRVIKSQGHCQRHGAKAKRCKVEGCNKQAQGTHNGMCKRHWRAVHFPDQIAAKAEAARKKELEEQPPPPFGESVYDNVLPASIAYRPSFSSHQAQLEKANANAGGMQSSENPTSPAALVSTPTPTDAKQTPTANLMPLVNFLRDGALNKEIGWHRQAERRARGIIQCASLSTQLEPWEKQLALVEILLLSGGTPQANFRDLAHAWGRERGFHQVLAASVCTRRGEVERKKRSDAGKKSRQQPPGSTPVPAAKRPKPTTPPPTAPAPVAMYHPTPHQQTMSPQQHHIAGQIVQPQAPPLQLYQNSGVQWQQQPMQQHQHAQPPAQETQTDVQPNTNGAHPTSYN